MLAYYFNLALRSFGRNRVLTALMVLAIALGIGASMTTLTVFYVLSGDPVPGKSDRLFAVQLDPRLANSYTPGDEPPQQLTRYDAETLLREGRAPRQALMTGGSVNVEPERQGVDPFNADSRYTSADFFEMFAVPFQYGGGWDADADEQRARVAVISKEMNEQIFGGGDNTGRTMQLDRTTFRIVGILDEYRPTPKFYDMNASNGYGDIEQVFLPFSTSRDLDLARSGNMNCFRQRDPGQKDTDLGAGCVWMQYWAELASAADAADYRQYLVNYSAQQRSAGRFEREPNVQLRNVMEWLDFNDVLPSDVRLQMWLALGFLLVCLLNTVGLLLAKFLRRSSEIGVRRALGASRRAVFTQCLVEAGTIGLAGGALGLALAWLGLWAVRQQPTDYADLAKLDPAMLLVTFALALVASLLAGVLPAWRACQIAPAIQLKSQ
ncbi:ABC transporter permease [Luteimonas sp. SJ-92]|uniref:ABC transporter permease n=1 Tax=Luteimonas salinisoli TaxID=2752307 RepID=A0A853J9P0_9GAMM|nr:ABC transporter permease [Luteimonas salinisoli]NZA25575.1 ABC transporter permease [Luteimonas salinisoli]